MRATASSKLTAPVIGSWLVYILDTSSLTRALTSSLVACCGKTEQPVSASATIKVSSFGAKLIFLVACMLSFLKFVRYYFLCLVVLMLIDKVSYFC